jgi:sirohydrochlorin cobaltochelatase
MAIATVWLRVILLFRIILNNTLTLYYMRSFLTTVLILFLVINIHANGFEEPAEKVGVLVLAHGGSTAWNELVQDAVKPLQKKYPVEIAFGMALPRTIQEGIDKLESQGVNKIVVVPLFVSSHSFIIRQTEFLLGKRDVLADPPMVMDHSGDHHASASTTQHHSTNHDMHSQHSSHGSEKGLERLTFKSEIILTKALDDHPIVADIIHSRVQELSTNPAKETVIIVGHGPNPEEDNKNWVIAMESLADQVRAKQKSSARNIFSVTVRDDADKEIYEQAREHLRGLVRQASKQGDVIVVPLLLSKGGVEKGIVKRLEGLNYKWTGKTLLPDPKITQFIEVSVNEAIKK